MSRATIYPIVPEICQFCDEGLAWMTCYDDKYRCRTCVHRYAEEMGWDKLPEKYAQREEQRTKSAPPIIQAEPPQGVEDKIYQQPEMFD